MLARWMERGEVRGGAVGAGAPPDLRWRWRGVSVPWAPAVTVSVRCEMSLFSSQGAFSPPPRKCSEDKRLHGAVTAGLAPASGPFLAAVSGVSGGSQVAHGRPGGEGEVTPPSH